MLSMEEEYQIGRMIVRGLRDQDQILEDPETSEYIRSLGTRLSSQANDGSQRFNFFVVKDNSINAFALPGGFIGVNSGLLLDTKNESELAGVIAHEVAHVTQRHIARSIAAQSKSSLVSTAAMLAAILIGVAGGGDAAMAGMAAAQSLAIQQQISFTRANETEADRVGLGILARSNFDPQGMPAFFETMSRHAGSSEINIPEMLRTHPVTSTRIAETKERAAQLNVKPDPESVSYALTRERLRVLSTPPGEDPREYYAAIIGNEPDATSAQVYGRALALMMSGQAAKAVPIFQRLRDADPTVVQYHTALGQAQLLAGKGDSSLATLTACARAVPAQHRSDGAFRRGDDAAGRFEGRARDPARPVQRRAADARAGEADGAGSERCRRRRRLVLLHVGVPPDERRPAARNQPAAARAGRAEDHGRAARAVRGPPR